MVGLVDEALRSKFHLHDGLAAPSATLADPTTGTGTFFLGALKSIVETVRQDQGEGAVFGRGHRSTETIDRVEIQLGSFAVAQLRILRRGCKSDGKPPKTSPRMFVTNTLSDPEEEAGWISQMLTPLANQRKDAQSRHAQGGAKATKSMSRRPLRRWISLSWKRQQLACNRESQPPSAPI